MQNDTIRIKHQHETKIPRHVQTDNGKGIRRDLPLVMGWKNKIQE